MWQFLKLDSLSLQGFCGVFYCYCDCSFHIVRPITHETYNSHVSLLANIWTALLKHVELICLPGFANRVFVCVGVGLQRSVRQLPTQPQPSLPAFAESHD